MGDPAGEDRLDALFHRAVAVPGDQRAAFLARECGDDAALRTELEELLEADGRTGSSLEAPWHGGFGKVPSQVGAYRLGDELGEGGMGRVFAARQEHPVERDVAMKILKGGFADEHGQLRFRAEQQALARMRHRGVATILDGGALDDGRPFLVMERVDGVPLHRWVEQAQPDLEERLQVFVAICDAVQHAHQKGIIHRDLKPSNVLVEAGDRGPEPRVIDFGIARLFADDGAGETLHTVEGAVLGTPAYMSPEQLAGAADADARSDVYSLGVLLHELLVGARPFETTGSISAAQRIDAVRQRDPEPPSRAVPAGLPRDLDWIVLKALAREPQRRYATVDALAADIRRFFAHEPITARPASRWYLLRTFVSRHRTAVLGAAATVLALGLGLGLALREWNRATGHLTDYRMLVDDKRVVDLQREAGEELWPPWPERVSALDGWIRRAEALLMRRPALEARAEELRLAATARDGAGDREEIAYQAQVLARLLAGIEEMAAATPSDRNLAGVRARRDEALRIGGIVAGHGAAWERALAACRELNGVQMGLVPLGPNPASGLWEFWHPETGERPEPDPGREGSWLVTEATGMVFVLVPGGRFVIGAVHKDPEHAGEAPFDPRAAPMERFVRPVTLDGFFLSRYEMTQGQWLRVNGANPAAVQGGNEARGHMPTLAHPVEQVNWYDADEQLRRMGLVLPTEAQWEYACRAGTKTTYAHPGDARALVGFAANLADAASGGYLKQNIDLEPDADDGYALTAPVGTFAPNAWGFHDVHGNVGEWCRDWLLPYGMKWGEGDGLRVRGEHDSTTRCWRGGDFADASLMARSASRNSYQPDLRTARVGVRPARAIGR